MGIETPSYRGFRYPAKIISHCVWLYHRCGISPHFRPGRHRLGAEEYRRDIANRFTTWNEVTGTATAA